MYGGSVSSCVCESSRCGVGRQVERQVQAFQNRFEEIRKEMEEDSAEEEEEEEVEVGKSKRRRTRRQKDR